MFGKQEKNLKWIKIYEKLIYWAKIDISTMDFFGPILNENQFSRSRSKFDQN